MLGEPPPQKKKKKEKKDFSQMWVGGVADSQTRSKPLKTPQITPKIAVVDPNFIFCSPKSHRNPGVGKQIWERSPLLLGGFENWLPLI